MLSDLFNISEQMSGRGQKSTPPDSAPSFIFSSSKYFLNSYNVQDTESKDVTKISSKPSTLESREFYQVNEPLSHSVVNMKCSHVGWKDVILCQKYLIINEEG